MRLRLTHPLSQVVLASIFLIAASIACTAYKSAGSQTASNSPSTQQETSAENSASVTTQDNIPCTLTLIGSPTVNGVRLGMTVGEVLALFPGSKEDSEVSAALARPPSQFGASSFLIRAAKYEAKEKFSGVSQITVTLLDGRVSSFTVQYNGPEYSHVDKFVEKFREGRGLPPVDQWDVYVGMDNALKTLKCAEFEVNVFIGGEGGNLNYVLVKDLVAEKTLKDRRAKARAQASPTPDRKQ